MRNSQLSRYGAISKILPDVSPGAKVWFVGDTDDTGFVDFVNEFPPDNDGVVRVFSSVFDSTMTANLRDAKGDVVLVQPGFSESITTDQALTKNGVMYRGLGAGNARPTIQYDNANASISLDTDNISWDNFRLLASVSAVAVGVDIVGAGCSFRKNSMQFDANGDDFAIAILATGDQVIIDDNEILGEDTVGPTVGIALGSSNFTKVRRNYVTGQFSVSALTDTTASLGLLIGDNKFNNQDTLGGLVMSFAATSTGLCYKNMLASGDTAAAIAALIVEGAMKWTENYVVNDTAETGAVIPASASG